MTLTKWATITNVPEAPNPTRSENLDTSVAETASKGCHWLVPGPRNEYLQDSRSTIRPGRVGHESLPAALVGVPDFDRPVDLQRRWSPQPPLRVSPPTASGRLQCLSTWPQPVGLLCRPPGKEESWGT